ncbi:M13 family metallopeptidase [Williamsia deligens]|uniref:M13 family metallopeptidase n=1 Tax=Williamsia deligens TaxID=321325 RepID=A0ABW3G2L1_9NOCA|nr:M13 family metallopeptidase [Williamsia deligens]MCP2195017.1 putative endopeptidase [Williamsia deligens]
MTDRDAAITVTPQVGRRAFLAGLGGLTAAALLAACGDDSPRRPALTPDLSGLDNSVTAESDLYRHVNGGWLSSYQIPADKAGYSTFDELDDNAQKQLRQIIEGIGDDATGEDAKIRDLYRSFMDTGRIDAAGVSPVAGLLAAIDRAPDKNTLTRGLAALSTAGATGIVDLYIAPDQADSTRYVANIVQSGIGLPDESYYREASYAEDRAKYVEHLTTLARLAGLTDPQGRAQRAMSVETAVAAGHLTTVENRDAKKTYNPRTWAEFTAAAPGIDWAAWRSGLGLGDTALSRVVVAGPKSVATAATVWAQTPIDTLRDYMRLTVLRSYSRYLSTPFRSANFDFFSRTLNGVEKEPERWKSGVALVDSLLGEALGKKYVAKHFAGSAKDDARELVATIVEAYRRSFASITWFSDATRKEANTKLDKLTVKIGYPDTWRDYSALQISRDDLVESVRNGQMFATRRQFAKLGTKVDKTEWQMTPQTVNAYYDPTFNEIVFPAAILQYPFFSPDAEPQVNYGGIGAVIGHEIGHGFDDQGSQYDADGNLRDWWTASDRAEFTKRSNALIAQYDTLVPKGLPADKQVNGALTVGENLADLGGLSIALSAYRIAAEKAKSEPSARDVFLSWARIWRGKYRPAAAEERLATDPHSPPEFRCNQVVRNISAFYETFGVGPSDPMWLAPDKRVTIW